MNQVTQAPADRLLDEATGEIISRTDTHAVAGLLKRICDFERTYRQAKRWCVEALLERCDERKEWTVQIGAIKVVADPPTASNVQWDENKLLQLEKVLPRDRYLELCRPTVTLKPDTRALQSIAKRDPDSEAGRIIREAEDRLAKRRGVRVS